MNREGRWKETGVTGEWISELSLGRDSNERILAWRDQTSKLHTFLA